MVPLHGRRSRCAMLMGLGNGAVFELVPEHFPKDTGTVTGLVGALGGLGGFFPPLLLGVFSDRIGAIWPGFLLLSATAFGLRLANERVFRPSDVEWTRSLTAPARQALERPGGRVGHVGDGSARRSDRRGIAEPRPLRCGARRLHVRDALCRVRDQLPVCDVVAPAADSHAGDVAGRPSRRPSPSGETRWRLPRVRRVRRESIIFRRAFAAWRTG